MEQQRSKHEKRRLKLEQRQQEKLNQQHDVENKDKTGNPETFCSTDHGEKLLINVVP